VLHHSSFQEEEFRLWQRYQAAVHRDKPSRLNKWSYCNFLVAHPFRSAFDAPPELVSAASPAFHVAQGTAQPRVAAAGNASAEVQERAPKQEQERLSPSISASAASSGYSVTTSLTDSASGSPSREGTEDAGEEAADDRPVTGSELTADSGRPVCGYGAFHLQFWLGGHLIAVSYVDMLPRCADGCSVCPSSLLFAVSSESCCNSPVR
jgi:Arginine-tRNA-protein transferase, C terminus